MGVSTPIHNTHNRSLLCIPETNLHQSQLTRVLLQEYRKI